MLRRFGRSRLAGAKGPLAAALAAGLLSGCQTAGPPGPVFGGGGGPLAGRSPHFNPAPKAPEADDSSIPKELNLVTMPPYTVMAPDILLIDAQRLIPLPPYHIEPLDVLYLVDPETRSITAPEREINGPYPVSPDGTIDLGPNYGGPVRVNDLTTTEAEKVIEARIRQFSKTSKVSASLAQARGAQQIRGEHLINPDGTVSLGLYGSVYVAGMTTTQAKAAIEAHLARFLLKPEVSVQVAAYNSKYYYVITDFAGAGEQVQRIPATGNETVLDAISFIGGLSPVSSKQVWIARPAPAGVGDQILPVDWKGITRRGNTRSNYQVLPGDRVFVMAQPLAKLDNTIARVTSPFERIISPILLGATAAQTLNGNLGGFGNNNGGGTVVNVAPTGTTTGR